MFEIVSECKGGGYKYCRTNPPHPKANSKGLYPLHRVLMENRLGRYLEGDEQVHHKDGNRDNNSIENLEVLSVREHARIHSLERQVEDIKLTCPICGESFMVKPNLYRLRLKRSACGRLFCSRPCLHEHLRGAKQ